MALFEFDFDRDPQVLFHRDVEGEVQRSPTNINEANQASRCGLCVFFLRALSS